MTLPDRAALRTMHGKAAAIAPPLARLGITLVVPKGLDTDRFGTFTAEVPRKGTMDDAAWPAPIWWPGSNLMHGGLGGYG